MESPNIVEGVKVPNFFYDLIVFMTPSITLLIGVIFGLGNSGYKYIAGNAGLVKAEGFDFFLLFVLIFTILLFLAYEYGRLAEALSSLISDFVGFLRKRKILFLKQKDYNINFKKEITKLNLHELLDDDKMDKWTIYFYAMRFQPEIGSDILKRYAWEKLSRSSSFTFAVLFCISTLFGIERLFKIESVFGYYFMDTGMYGFGSLAYSMVVFIMFILTCYEYYRRRSWNNDLLIKVLPVITLPSDFVVMKVNKENPDSETKPKDIKPKS